MKKTKAIKTIDELPYEIDEVEYQIGIIHYNVVKGDRSCTDSDMDYYGYVESDWVLLDSDGNEANVEITGRMEDEIETIIADYYTENDDDGSDAYYNEEYE